MGTTTAAVMTEGHGGLDETTVRSRTGRKRNGTPDGRTPRTGRRGRRSAIQGEVTSAPVRYFLLKEAPNGSPVLDQELPGENEVLIEALKQNRSFVMVTEWQATVDTKSGVPVIGKEPASPR